MTLPNCALLIMTEYRAMCQLRIFYVQTRSFTDLISEHIGVDDVITISTRHVDVGSVSSCG